MCKHYVLLHDITKIASGIFQMIIKTGIESIL